VKPKIRLSLAILSFLSALAGLSFLLWRGDPLAYESPSYRVVEKLSGVELRAYEPYRVAEVTVDGELETAGSRGFRILAKYIFGDNEGKRKIAMTAPVSQEKSEGSRVAMTAPVTQEKAGDRYTIQFMMPSDYSRDELPRPRDRRISIRELPARTFAAIRYSGTWSEQNYRKHLEQLMSTLRAEGYEPVGEPIWARYNPPFMPWFLRRNEILTAFRARGSAS